MLFDDLQNRSGILQRLVAQGRGLHQGRHQRRERRPLRCLGGGLAACGASFCPVAPVTTFVSPERRGGRGRLPLRPDFGAGVLPARAVVLIA